TMRIAMSAHSLWKHGPKFFAGTASPSRPFIQTNGPPIPAGCGFSGAGVVLLQITLTGRGVNCRCVSLTNMFSFFGCDRFWPGYQGFSGKVLNCKSGCGIPREKPQAAYFHCRG